MLVSHLAPLVALAALSTPAAASPAPLRDQVARRWAPDIYQETLDPVRDFIAAFDFDGDWDGQNNAANVSKFPLRAVVYYAVAETPTHWFVTYMPYHPVDYKIVNGHPHDTESVLLVVEKRGGPLGTPVAMETRFHTVWYQYARPGAQVKDGADDVDGPIHFDSDGRPEVYAQRGGHGLCGGFSPTAIIPDLQLTCEHQAQPHFAQQGVIYRYAGRAELPQPGVKEQTVGYDLVDMAPTLWAHADERRAYVHFADYGGERCATRGWSCPRSIGTALAGLGDACASPWGQSPGRGAHAVGDEFLDPAFTMARRLRFAEPFSLDYVWNPYLGIGREPPEPLRYARPLRPLDRSTSRPAG